MTTFEKFLREEEKIHIAETQQGRYGLFSNGSLIQEYEDDVFGGVSRRLGQQLKKMFPAASGLPLSPPNHISRGERVERALATIDLEKLVHFLRRPTVSALNIVADAKIELLATPNPTPAQKYEQVNVLLQLAVAAYDGVSDVTGEDLPFCTKEEYIDVATCERDDLSLKWHGKFGKIPPSHVEAFRGMHPHSVLSADGRELRVGPSVTTLLELLNLPPLPAWIKDLSFTELRPPLACAPESAPRHSVSAFPATATAPRPVPRGATTRGPQPGPSGNGHKHKSHTATDPVQAGVDFVNAWYGRDANCFRGEDREVLSCGYKGASQVLTHVSKKAHARLFRNIRMGDHNPRDVIGRLIEDFKDQLPPGDFPYPTDTQCALMAAALLVRRKGVFRINQKVWTRVIGEL